MLVKTMNLHIACNDKLKFCNPVCLLDFVKQGIKLQLVIIKPATPLADIIQLTRLYYILKCKPSMFYHTRCKKVGYFSSKCSLIRLIYSDDNTGLL